MLHNNEAPNFALKGVANAKLSVTPITMGGETQVKQVPELLGQKFGVVQGGCHDAEPLPGLFASKDGSASITVQAFKDQFQGEIIQRCLAGFQLYNDSFLDRKMFFQAEWFHSSELT
jgi:hypothetical protein